jgi:hypothetical protein
MKIIYDLFPSQKKRHTSVLSVAASEPGLQPEINLHVGVKYVRRTVLPKFLAKFTSVLENE